MPRLVTCHYCKTLTRMPDVHPKTPLIPAILEWTTGERYVYREDSGLPVMVPAFDPILEDFVQKHNHGRDDQATLEGMIQVFNIDEKTWNAVDAVTQIKSELQKQNDAWYEEKDEYRDSALKCYNAHGNPDLDHGCRDYMDDSKRIGPRTYKVEDEHRTVEIPDRFRQYLCYVCPYQQTYIQVELRQRRGAYK
jgi:hypothetical protein